MMVWLHASTCIACIWLQSWATELFIAWARRSCWSWLWVARTWVRGWVESQDSLCKTGCGRPHTLCAVATRLTCMQDWCMHDVMMDDFLFLLLAIFGCLHAAARDVHTTCVHRT